MIKPQRSLKPSISHNYINISKSLLLSCLSGKFINLVSREQEVNRVISLKWFGIKEGMPMLVGEIILGIFTQNIYNCYSKSPANVILVPWKII